MPATIVPIQPYLTQREEDERREQAEIEAGRFFDDATKAQREAYKAATTSAARMHGHGSDAHCAMINLAKRQWDHDTAEARALYERSVERLIATGEIGDELDEAWTALVERETVRNLMAAE